MQEVRRQATSGLLEIFYCTTKIALFFRFTSLIRSPTPPTDDRENADSTPRLQKVIFVKIGLPKAVTDIPKKVSTFPKKVYSITEIVV